MNELSRVVILAAVCLSVLGTVSTDASAITAEGQALLEADWLVQCLGKPTGKHITDEIGWARQLADRLTKIKGCPSLKVHLGKLTELEKKIEGTKGQEALAKLYFMIAGYAIYFTLPKLFDSEILWGNYLLVVGLVSVIDNVIVTGTIQGVSKFTSEDESRADGVKRSALLVQLMVGGGLAVAYVFLAPLIAAWERDEALGPLYR